ncbi:PTPRD [Acanthosepion pharaonis]|uniref:PTPRD n=1 Tax=Acanthosepion pharaonis TaxID=158019 RepID=A0A812AQG8_ACAPH|nr:PTPRD [Sepia pharaonis]
MRLQWRFLIILAALFSPTWAEDPPRITLAPTNQKVAEEKIVSFFCKASGNPGPSFSWKKGSRRITTNRNRLVIKEMPHGSVLRIEPVKQKDLGVYECIADNGVGTKARANASLHVYPKTGIPEGYPRITIHPSLKAVEKDRNTVLQCGATGIPEPKITWLRDFIPVDLSNPRLTLLESGALQIERSQESDVGKYECVAENEKGVDYSYAANLYVKVRRVPPHFSMAPENVDVQPGADVNLTCVAVGSPMPQHQSTITRRMEEKQSYWLCFFTLAVVTSMVSAAVPSAPVKLTISHIKPKSVQLTWDKSNSDDVLSYIIQYRPYSDESKEFKEISGITKTRGYKVHPLEPYTRYEFRVIAVNKYGRSPPSETVQELTAPQAPGTAPRNLRGKAASATTIALLWDEPEIPNGIIKGYKIFYTMNPDLPIILWDHKTHTDSQKRVATLTNLKTNSTYTINILAFSSAGQGPLSDEIQVMTNPGDSLCFGSVLSLHNSIYPFHFYSLQPFSLFLSSLSCHDLFTITLNILILFTLSFFSIFFILCTYLFYYVVHSAPFLPSVYSFIMFTLSSSLLLSLCSPCFLIPVPLYTLVSSSYLSLSLIIIFFLLFTLFILFFFALSSFFLALPSSFLVSPCSIFSCFFLLSLHCLLSLHAFLHLLVPPYFLSLFIFSCLSLFSLLVSSCPRITFPCSPFLSLLALSSSFLQCLLSLHLS